MLTVEAAVLKEFPLPEESLHRGEHDLFLDPGTLQIVFPLPKEVPSQTRAPSVVEFPLPKEPQTRALSTAEFVAPRESQLPRELAPHVKNSR